MRQALVLTLEGTGETRELAGGALSVGRGQDNDWVLVDPGPTPLPGLDLGRRYRVRRRTELDEPGAEGARFAGVTSGPPWTQRDAAG